MARRVLVVLVGTGEGEETDHYQLLQQQEARVEGDRAGVATEVVLAPGFDHLRVIRKRLRATDAPPIDAVVVEPASVSSTGLILKELDGTVGLVLLNIWSLEVEDYARRWKRSLPFGTISTPHRGIGEIQGRQVAARLARGGHVLCVTGPEKSSAAVERLAGLRSVLGPEVTVYTTEAGQWTEPGGATAFESWYSLYRSRAFSVDVVAAQSDELAVGAREAGHRAASEAHREVFRKAAFLGIDACPGYGRRLVDSGVLAASVTTPANTGEAIRRLKRFWDAGEALPLQAFTEPRAYPPASAA